MLDKTRAKIGKGWTNTKKLLGMMSVWGLIFSLATIGRLRVAFDYDDTLVNSTPAFEKAFKSGAQPFSPGFWSIVNKSYDLETPKVLPNAIAWTLRLCGFKVVILSSRPPNDAEALKKEWRRLAGQFIFTQDRAVKHKYLSEGNFVLFFGDSDSDILEGRRAHVPTIRILRSPKSSYKEDYHPGTLNEWRLPLSRY